MRAFRVAIHACLLVSTLALLSARSVAADATSDTEAVILKGLEEAIGAPIDEMDILEVDKALDWMLIGGAVCADGSRVLAPADNAPESEWAKYEEKLAEYEACAAAFARVKDKLDKRLQQIIDEPGSGASVSDESHKKRDDCKRRIKKLQDKAVAMIQDARNKKTAKKPAPRTP